MSDNVSNDTQPSAPPRIPIWFWILGILALLWNLLGLMAFAAEMLVTEDAIAALPQEQQELYRNVPPWLTAFFALAVFGGVAGSILLLLRNKLAVPVLGLSLLGVLVQYGHMFFMTNTASVMGAGAMILPALVVVVSIGLIPYAIHCKSQNYLR